jgi:hypothetical protein
VKQFRDNCKVETGLSVLLGKKISNFFSVAFLAMLWFCGLLLPGQSLAVFSLAPGAYARRRAVVI